MNKWLSPNKVFLALLETFFRLIEPHNPRQHPTRLRRMRLLSGILVFLALLTLIGAFATMPNRSSGENTYIYLLIGFIIFVFSYLLNFYGRDKLAIWSVLLYLTILPFASWYSKNNYSFQEFYGSFIWIFLAILLASLLLDPWSVSLLTVMNIVTLMLLPKVVPDLDYIMVYDFIGSFIPLSILLVAGSALRRRDIALIEQQNDQISTDEIHLKQLLISNPAVVYSALPAKGRPFTFVSSNAANRLGYSAEEIMSDADFWEKHVHADDAPGFLSGFSSLLEQGSLLQTYRFRHKDGTYRWLQDEQRLLRDSGNQLSEIVGYFSDITEKVRTEETMRVKDKALDSAANAIVITNTAGDITWVNPAFSDLTGYKLEEVLGANPRILKSGQHSKQFYQDLWKTIKTGNIWRGELINKRKDGSLYNDEMTITPMKDQRGNISHFIAIKQDATARKQFERELQHSYSLSAALGKVATDIQSILDIDQVYKILENELLKLDINYFLAFVDPKNQDLVIQYVGMGSMMLAAIEKLTGTKTLGYHIHRKNFPFFEALVEQSRPQYFRNIYTIVKGMLPDFPEPMIKGIIRLGRIGPDYSILFLPLIKDKKVIGILSLWGGGIQEKDISILSVFAAQVANSIRISELFDQTQSANRAKTEFISRMSHELRTPLNSILGFSQLMEMSQKEPLTDGQRKHVRQIVQGGQHLLRLINEILDLSRIEAGQMRISLEPVGVRDAIRDACELAKPLADPKDIQIEIQDEPGSNLFILGDRQGLKQVCLNLMSNAVKYNRQNGHIAITQQERPDKRLRISVSDTGYGIPPQKMENIFMPFERLGAETSNIEGTGLGLALSKRLMELMGGKIGFESTIGQGSTFWIELPITDDPLASLDPQKISEPIIGLPMSAFKIIYIEDNKMNFELIRQILTEYPQVELLWETRAAPGLAKIRQTNPDLILLDLHLPGISGQEALKLLKSDQAISSIPVVVLSADITSGVIGELMKLGAQAFLTKPLNIEDFIQLVDEMMRGKEKRNDQ